MHQFDNDEILEMYLTAFTTSYDPHTTYMSASSLDNFRILLGLKLEGIGAQLKDEDGQCVVANVVPGGPADKHGKLKAEDKVVSVGQGEEGEMVDVVNMKLNDVVQLIRGDAGTTVRLGVLPEGETDVKIYKITRDKIELTDSAASGKVFEDGKKVDGSPYKIGVIDLPSFYMDMDGARQGLADFRSTTVDVRKILEDFKSKSVDVVVLDLRRNGGGSLTEAINLTGLFIDQGPVVQVKGPDNRVQHYDDFDPGMAWDGPLVVMISKLSASASEILAGAIQDYRRGLIVGDETTHGKGTVQSLLDLGPELIGGPRAPNLGALKITMQQFYRPNGDSTQKRGVLADIVLPSITTYMDIGEADEEYAIEFDKVRRADYSPVNLVSSELLTKLRSESSDRLKGNSEFADVLKKIQRYREQKELKRVELNEEKFFAERAELNAEKEEQSQLDEPGPGGAHDSIKRDYYLNEVMDIAKDYVRELTSRDVARK
jgi:carboxyl-terminal processing protease